MQDAPLPQNFVLDLGPDKTLLGRGNDTATRDCDSRAVPPPPRPVISLLLPAHVNNSPGCQMQVAFVAAMKERGGEGSFLGGRRRCGESIET